MFETHRQELMRLHPFLQFQSWFHTLETDRLG